MRFHGIVGYANSEETSPGVWKDVITERTYFGDVLIAARRLENSSLIPPTLNTDVTVENRISLMADQHAYDNFEKMRYIRWNDKDWTVTRVEIQRPRLILSIGGLWNGETASAPVSP